MSRCDLNEVAFKSSTALEKKRGSRTAVVVITVQAISEILTSFLQLLSLNRRFTSRRCLHRQFPRSIPRSVERESTKSVVEMARDFNFVCHLYTPFFPFLISTHNTRRFQTHFRKSTLRARDRLFAPFRRIAMAYFLRLILKLALSLSPPRFIDHRSV